LRNTSGQRGAFGHKHAVLIRLNRYSEFHANESNAFPKGRKRVAMGSNRRSFGSLKLPTVYGPLEEPQFLESFSAWVLIHVPRASDGYLRNRPSQSRRIRAELEHH
jgi:hypothetical protein